MKIKSWLSIVSIAILISSCQDSSKETPFPTRVNFEMENGELKDVKKDFFKKIHQAAEGVDWKDIEAKTAFVKHQEKAVQRLGINTRNEEEIANGDLIGTWYERGSKNLAGSLFRTLYDPMFNQLYAISAGGTLWKGKIQEEDWQVINQDLIFDVRMFFLVSLSNDNQRMIASVNGIPHYSDDAGNEWTPSTGLEGFGRYITDPVMINDEIFFFTKESYWADNKLFRSTDLGETYNEVYNFTTSDDRNLAINKPHGTEDLYMIEQISEQQSKVHIWDKDNQSLQLLRDSVNVSFSENGRANIDGVINEDGILRFYVFNGQDSLFMTEDTFKTFQFQSVLPIRPWRCGVYASKYDPDFLITGGVNAYYSHDAGQNWILINEWWEYYDNVEFKLHADMMYFEDFMDQEGNPFLLTSHHGGLSISYNKAITNQNISLDGLNIGQFYDVTSHPLNNDFIFGGSQDQGLQRGEVVGDLPIEMVQVISGDYGHTVFTENKQRLWTVYPGGWVSYYPEPITQGYTADYTVESDNESVWIPPLMAHPDESKNAVFMAGGNMNGGPGAHVIQLEYNNGFINASQFPFDFTVSGGAISALATNPFDDNKWYVATDNGKFYRSTDGGQSFVGETFNVPGGHYLYGSCILPSKLNEDVIYISGSGYSTAGVLKSTDGGNSFQSMTNGLPPTLIFSLAPNEDESLIFAATEAGPYVFISENNQWYDLSGLAAPAQRYWSVEFLEDKQIARFGTYGRGIWDFAIKTPLSTTNILKENLSFEIFPNPLVDQSFNLRISTDIDLPIKLSVFDMAGKIALQQDIYQRENKIQLPTIPAGQYIIQLKNSEWSETKSIIKN